MFSARKFSTCILLFLAVILGSSAAQDYSSVVKSEIDQLLKESLFISAVAAVDVYNLSTREIVYRKNEKLLLHPASNMKILTSAAGLRFLGNDYLFSTEFGFTGMLEDGILSGDLYFIGGFDPDLSYDELKIFAKKLSALGVSEIRGNLYCDVSSMDSLYWGSGWMWDDDPSTDFPYMTPFLVSDAALKVVYSPGKAGKPIDFKIIPEEIDWLEIKNETITTSEDTSDLTISRDWLNGNNHLEFRGDISMTEKEDTADVNLVNPDLFALKVFVEYLETTGIQFSGKIGIKKCDENITPVHTHSRKYGEVIKNLNKESDNLSAEMTLRALAHQFREGSASAEKGIELIDSMIVEAGLDPKSYRLVDGSGVSHYNLVSAELLCEVLKYFYFELPDLYKILSRSFPLAGIDGTLQNRMKGSSAYRNVMAKTGTLSGVSNLSGYLRNKSGNLIAFSILIQNFVEDSKEARKYQDLICEVLSGN